MLPTERDLSVEIKPSLPQVPDVISLLDYLEVIVKQKRMIFCITIIAFICSIFVSLLLPQIFTATAKILPPQQDTGLMVAQMGIAGGMGTLAGDLLGKGTPADMYASILQSETIKDAIIDKFKLMSVYKKKFRIDTYAALNNYVDITAGKKDGIISISVDDKDPKRAADMANAYVDELKKLSVRLNISGAGQNKIFLEERLSKAKSDLSVAEDNMKSFQTKNKIVSISDQAQATISGIAQLKAQLVTQEIQLMTLQRQFTDSSQEVKNVKTAITNIQNQILSLEGKSAGGSILGIDSVPELGKQYIRFMREFKVQENLVELLTKQYELAKITEAKDIITMQVLQTAREPDKKSRPKRSAIVLVSTFVAGFIAILFAFIRESMTRMPEKDKDQLQNIIKMIRFR